ncbi:ring-1,2-phenylacetyl-CoA epoxidase subunit PaaE [Pedobacter sp. UYP30]|uniref:ferredoxin--NADP reductase n=1 Tax=Pedobacter sp. UYP30 TaxID=1756400 RepID=UPI003394A2D0
MYKLKVIDIVSQPGDNMTIKFESCGQPYPTYLAGQFLSLIFKSNDREIRRSYSFNSSPVVNEPLAITVKRVENGEISRFLHHKTTIGDEFNALSPQGIFSYHPIKNKKRDLFLFAAGVGITPLFSILKTALISEEQSSITLIYSNSSIENVLFYDELNAWQKNNPDRLTIVYLFSNSKNLATARLNKFYIEKLLKKHLKFERSDALFYSCGPIIYMDLCRITLLGAGFDPSQVKRETFVMPEDEPDEDDGSSEKIVDKNTYSVVIKFNGKTDTLLIPYPKRILEVALANNINLPYSCQAGMCSACTAFCTKGGVAMDYNEVLTDDEIASGKVLVCTGRPTENGTTLQWL